MEALLEDDHVEAVYLPLPNHLHPDLILRCLDAGKHVLCEKPMLREVADFDAVAKAARRQRKVVAEAFMTAYHTLVRRLIELAREGAFGEVMNVASSFTGTLRPLDGYRTEAANGGGSLWDVGIYALRPVVEILGSDPVSIASSVLEGFTPPIDLSVSALFGYTDGRSGFIRTSFIAGESQRLEVVGSRVVASLERASTPSLSDTSILLSSADGGTSSIEVEACDPCLAMIDEVGEAFRSGVELSWNLERAREMTAIIRQVLASWS